MSLSSTTTEITSDLEGTAKSADNALPDPGSTEVITVWSRPRCVQCNATYRKLEDLRVEYRVENLEERPDMLEAFKAQGIMQAPVVVVPGREIWCGYRPDLIEQLANELAADRLISTPDTAGATGSE